MADLAVAAHRLLGLRDASRTDAVVTPDGVAHFLEVNVAPAPDNGVAGEVEATPLADRIEAVRAIAKIAA